MSAAPSVFGVLGGTFDPVHRGHLAVARYVLEATGMARVLLMPSAVPPHKRAPRVAAAHHRQAMLRLAVADQRGLEICTLELDSGRVCYTIDTLRQLRAEKPDRSPVFVMGLDSLVELPTWKDYGDLVQEFDLIAVDRPAGAERSVEPAVELAPRVVELGDAVTAGARFREARGGRGGRIFRLRMPPIPISSREIRSLASAGKPLGDLVPPPVARYILSNRLYQ